MKIAFLILAHKSPSLLSNLINQLQYPENGIFVHLDKRCNADEFTKLFNKNHLKIDYIIQTQKIVYSSITYIHATLNLIQEAYNSNFDYFILISGQDLPIKSSEYIQDFFTMNNNINYIKYTPFPVTGLTYNGLMRIKFYSYRILNRMETYFPWKERNHKLSKKGYLLNLFLWLKTLGKGTREFPLKMKPYYSSQWWNMSREAIAYILKFIEYNPEYLDYHKNALHPEEMFFQSILLNADEFKDKIINDNLRFIRWYKGNKHPEVINEQDIEAIKKSNAIFARKFDDISVINKLYQS